MANSGMSNVEQGISNVERRWTWSTERLFAAKGAEEILEAVDLYLIHRRKEHSYFAWREALSREPLEIADGKIA